MIQIPKQLQKPALSFVLLGKWNVWKHEKTKERKVMPIEDYEKLDEEKIWKPQGKAPFERAWQKNGHSYDDQKLLQHKTNFGVIGGSGNLRIIDVDDKSLIPYFNEKIGNTFTIQTGTGGRHYYIFSEYDTNRVFVGKKGELRANKYQVVSAPCKHPNGKYYEIIDNSEIKTIPKDEVSKILKPYLREEISTASTTKSITEFKSLDRSEREFGEVCHLIKKGVSKEKIFEKMMAFSKWANPHHLDYREHTYKKALAVQQKHAPFELRDFDYFKKLKKEKNSVVNNLIGKETLTMLVSPPANFKSLVGLYMAMCIATGKDFLGNKTKKSPVMILDLENNDQIIKERMEKIKVGMGLRKKPHVYYFPKGEMVDVFDLGFVERIKKTIEKYGIKVIFLDTLRRQAPLFKENISDDVSKFYSIFFKPLMEKYGVSIIFLHHSPANIDGEKRYRGSTDLLAMVDTAYFVKRISKTSKKFKMECDKARRGEVEKLLGVINFHDQSIEFEKRSEDEEEVAKKQTFIEILNHIKDFLQQVGNGNETKKSDINSYLETKGYDVQEKRGTITRALEFLRKKGEIDMTAKGRYVLL